MCDLKVLLYEMSWVEAKEYFSKNDIAILPVGAIEQHGPANPLGTDYLIAKNIAEETARRTEVICLPTIPFGVSPHHKQFWGTVFVSSEALGQYVKDVCSALMYYGVHKIVVVNGHGGNLAALSDLARNLRDDGVFMSVFQWWTATPKLMPDIFLPEERRHAGAEETSVNMALYSSLVNMARAKDEEPRKSKLQAEGMTLPLFTIDETTSGTYGKQTTASPEKGRKVFEAVVNELERHVEVLKKSKIDDLLQKAKA
jgi:creatinine amidohydrolase